MGSGWVCPRPSVADMSATLGLRQPSPKPWSLFLKQIQYHMVRPCFYHEYPFLSMKEGPTSFACKSQDCRLVGLVYSQLLLTQVLPSIIFGWVVVSAGPFLDFFSYTRVATHPVPYFVNSPASKIFNAINTNREIVRDLSLIMAVGVDKECRSYSTLKCPWSFPLTNGVIESPHPYLISVWVWFLNCV